MSNQIVISSGAKVRSLEGVITGTSGVLGALGINVSNGIPQLDSNGKILVSQLPNSVMEYKGTWNVTTNTPYLVDGVGNAGDVYIVTGAATGGTTHNFGNGGILFYNGDQAIYDGSLWQRASGSSGTVTSVGLTAGGNALTISNSPIVNSGNINVGFAGSSTQYIAGDGTLVTFPTLITEAQNLITDVYNETGATLTKGTVVYINGGHGNLPTVTKAIATGDSTSAQTYGVVQADITNNNNGHVVVIGSLGDLDTQAYAAGTQLYLSSTTAGAWTSTKQYAPAHLVYVGIVVRSHPTQGVVEIKIQNGFEMDELHNVSAQSPSNGDILQYNSTTSLWTSVAGTTTNIAEGSNLYFTNARAIGSTLTGYVSGAGTISSTDSILTAIQKLNGNVSGLVTGVSSVFGRTGAVVAASGDYTTTEVTEGTNLYFTNARARGAMSANVGSALTYDSATGRYTLLAADTSTSGYLTSTDWNTFNNKQASLGTGTTSQYLRGDLTWATPPTPTLDDLTDVVITSPTNGQVLTYRFGDWKNETPASAPVTSVFGRTGVVVATSGDYNTDLVTEGTTNLYYTNTRARAALSANVGSALTYNSSTGRFTLNAADGTTEGYVTAADYNYWDAKQDSLGTGTTSQWLRGDLTWSTVPAPALDDLTDVTITTPSNGQLLRYQAGTWINFTPTYIVAGYLSATAPLSYNSGTGVFSISQATTSTNGYLSSTDWNTFNGKQTQLNGTGFVKASGTTISYDNTSYLPLTGGTMSGGFSITNGNSTYSTPMSTDVPNIYIYNSNSSSTTAHSILTLRTNGGTSGNPFISFDINGVTGYTAGIDNSDSDAFKIAATWSSFSTPAIRIATTGTIKFPQYTTNGFIKFSGSDGSLSVDTNTYNSGSGTTNYISKFTGTNSIGNSLIYDDGSKVYIGTTTTNAISTSGLTVNGSSTSYVLYNGGVVGFLYGASIAAGIALSSTNDLRFETGDGSGSNWPERMRLFKLTGNLSLGYGSSPADAGYKLDVNGTGRFNISANTSTVTEFTNSGIYGSWIDLIATGTGGKKWRMQSTANSAGEGGSKFYINNQTDGTTGFTITSDIKVGIGTTSPATPLAVKGSANNTLIEMGNYSTNSGFLQSYDRTASTFRTLTLYSSLLDVQSAATFSSSVTANSTSGISGTFTSSNFFGSIDLENTGGAATGKWNVQAVSGAQIGGSAGSSFGIYSYGASAYRLFINSSGNVGIGTTSPNAPLHVQMPSDGSSGVIFRYIGGTANPGLFISVNETTKHINLTGSGSSVGGQQLRLGAEGNANVLNIGGSNVLIGTTTDAGYKLRVNGTSYFDSDLTMAGGVGIRFGGDTRYGVAKIYNASVGDMFGMEQVGASQTGTGGAATRIFTAYSSGNFISLGWYTTATAFTDALKIACTSGAATFMSSVTATGFFESSDKRLKKELIDNPTSVNIENVKPKLYIKDGKEEIGYYAQDLQSILPSSVTEGKDGFLSLSYTQVHTAKIASLEKEVAELKELIKTLIK